MAISFKQILEREAADTKSRLLAKVPQWRDAADRLEIPTRLSTEQCSSAPTARYKAALAQRIASRSMAEDTAQTSGQHPLAGHPRESCLRAKDTIRIADLTGGLGVDSWAFSQVASEVLYNEMNCELAEAVKHNFSSLGISNVTFRSRALIPSEDASVHDQRGPTYSCRQPGESSESTVTELLGDFKPDVVFLDPARRSESGSKVFRLEDCSPDITALKDELLRECPNILVKLSPMADISMICRQLGPCIREIHILGLGGECKELLAVLHRPDDLDCPDTPPRPVGTDGSDYPGIEIIVAELNGDHPVTLTFTSEEIESAKPLLPSGPPSAGDMLFEPGASLLKAGCFNLLCERFGLVKLGRSTHLYLVPEAGIDTDNASPESQMSSQTVNKSDQTDIGSQAQPKCSPIDLDELVSFGKLFTIKEILLFDKRSIREIAVHYPGCDVTARNLPVTSDELRKRIIDGRKGQHGSSGLSQDEVPLPTQVPSYDRSSGGCHIFGATVDFLTSKAARLLFITKRLTKQSPGLQ